MKTANQLRIDLANSQQTSKGRKKWLEMAWRVNEKECWAEKTTHNDVKIGSVVSFNDVSKVGGVYRIRSREVKAFAFGKHSMLVIYCGNIKKISLDSDGES